MGLNPRGRGRGRGGKGSFQNKGRRGGGIGGLGPMFRPSGMFCPPPMGFPPDPSFNGPFFGGPSGFNYRPPRPGFGKFPRKNFKRKTPIKNEAPVPEIDLSKPWVTEVIKNANAKKQECLEIWRKSKNDDDWSKYKTQKMEVQTLYDKAKEEYLIAHPEEAILWQNDTVIRKYYCETCDKGFLTDDDCYLHEAEHETCGREGCEFTAHPKIIAKHIRMQHDSGLYKRIGKLYTKEDIAKWIEERKKRYPSRKVIEEKKALEEEKIKRGEKLKDDFSRCNKSFQKNNKEKKTLKTIKARRSRKKKKEEKITQNFKPEEEEEISSRKGVPAFIGIKKIFEPEEPKEEKIEDLGISDDEWELKDKNEIITKPILNHSLQLLASNYNSEDEFDSESQKENKETKNSEDEGSGPEEVKTLRSTSPLPIENLKTDKCVQKRKLNNKKKVFAEKRRRITQENSECRSLTLLEKLLKNEIRHERNIILQCVHYVIKHNFFNS